MESALTDERRHFLHLEETQPGYRLPGRQASDNRVTFLEYEKYALITKHVLPFPPPLPFFASLLLFPVFGAGSTFVSRLLDNHRGLVTAHRA